MRLSVISLFLMLTALLAGCGSGTTAGNDKAVAAIRTTADSPIIYGFDLTITIPPGVIAQTNADGIIADGVFVAPPGTTWQARYTAPSGGEAGLLAISATIPNGFQPGDSAAVNLDIVGTPPSADAFAITFVGKDGLGAPISLNPTITTTLY